MQRSAARVGHLLLFPLLLAPEGIRAQTGGIAGRVSMRLSGADAVGVTVVATSSTGAQSASVVTREGGTYAITNLAAGSYRVRATRVGLTPSTLEQVIVRAGETARADLEMVASVQRLDPIVTTTGRGEAERSQESVSRIDVVTSTQIAETPAPTAVEVLKTQPALSIIQSGLAGFNVVSRGFNNAFSTSMLMLQDYRFAGVPSLRVNVPFLFTGTNDDIERIEVLQGPAAALYGPNSGNGVLHVITKSPFQWQGTTLTLDAGERSYLRGAVRHATAVNDRIALKISGEALTARDFEYVDPNEPATWSAVDTRIPAERRGQPVQRSFDLRKQSAEARLDLRPTDSTLMVTSAGWSKIGSGREITTTFGAAQVKDWSYLSLQQRVQRKRTFAQLFYNRSNSGNESGLDAAGTYYLRSGIPVVDRSSVLVGQLQQGARLGRTDVLVGGEYIATRPQTARTINGRNEDDDAIDEYGGYVQTKTALDRFELLLAARGDVNSRIEGAQFSPRAALMFKANANHNVRVTFNRAFNSPASFSFFLDQYSGQTPAPGMPVQILGNPAKQGWMFARSCAGGAAGDLCMRSPYIPNALAPASAAAAFPGFAVALPQIVQGLPASSFGAGGEAARQQLLGLLGQIGPILRSLRPTSAQVGTVLMDLGTRQPVSQVTDYDPLGTGFANTWEVGYKGIVRDRLRFDVAAWWQRRPADPTNQLLNPGVLFNPQQLGAYLGTSIAQALMAQGMPAAQAQATATQAAGALTPLMAAIPVGATAFTNPLDDQPFLVFSYRNAVGYVNVSGQDLSADLQVSEHWFLSGAYSHLSDNVFTDAPGATASNPLAANTPKHRATAAVRFERFSAQERGFSAELRGRYADAFPVNSGVLNSYGVGTPVRYDPVPVNALVDANVTWRLPLARHQAQVSVNASNLLDNRVRTFVGVPEIGRMLTTRLQYAF